MIGRALAILLLAFIATQPAVAQSSAFPSATAYRNGALAAAYLRVPLDWRGHGALRPQAGLRIAAAQDFRDPLSGAGSVTNRDILDLRVAGMSQPTFLLAGTPTTRPQAPKLNAIGTGGAIAIGGGVVLLLLLAALASGGGFGDTCPVINGDRSHCID